VGPSFCAPQRSDQADSHLNVRLILRPTIPHPDLTYLCEQEQSKTSGVRLALGRDSGRPVDFLEVDGNVSREHAAELEETIWKHLPDLRPLRADQFGDYNYGTEVRHSDPLALTQLLITYHLLRAYSKDAPIPFARPIAALSRLESVPQEAPVETVTK
jgi:phosphoribulokinase